MLCPENEVAVVLPGGDTDKAAALVASQGVNVICLTGGHFCERVGDDWLDALTCLCSELCPEFVVTGWGSFFMEVAPGLAAKLGAACITGVDGLEKTEKGPVFSRLLAGGAYTARMTAQKSPCVLCVVPGSFAPRGAQGAGNAPGSITRVKAAAPRGRVRVVERMAPDPADSALDTAQVVVGAGRGVGGPENMEIIRKTAALFGRSAVAGSRPVCDAGWLPASAQVGVTGRTISPALYLACGISGAFQHLAAISAARCVVAVNCDPAAPIFSRADFGIAGRLETFLPAFVELCREKKEKEAAP
jgi:electron transfer flavoprotein alpha subunit